MAIAGHVYFHTLCFDGIASAVLAIDVLGWPDAELHPVGYEERAAWLTKPLAEPAAVVDFLFHPHAYFWADHHPTTFANPAAENEYLTRRRESWFHDPTKGSCALLLHDRFQDLAHREELVRWANKIDAALYDSVDEALFSAEPALVISKGLAVANAEDCADLVRRLSSRPLSSVARDADVHERFARVQDGVRDSLQALRERSSLQPDGIVVADLTSESSSLGSRYAPYHWYPDANYSVVLYRTENGSKITAMRNPWRDFQSVPLGEIFKRYGGGGHQRVASVLIGRDRSHLADSILDAVVSDIQRAARRA
jgi:hypothetical protein